MVSLDTNVNGFHEAQNGKTCWFGYVLSYVHTFILDCIILYLYTGNTVQGGSDKFGILITVLQNHTAMLKIIRIYYTKKISRGKY
jgi:hypothetical protein